MATLSKAMLAECVATFSRTFGEGFAELSDIAAKLAAISAFA